MEIYKPVTGVAADLSQTRIVVCDVPDKPGVSAKIFGALAAKNISVDMIIQSYARQAKATNDVAFTVSTDDVEKTLELLKPIAQELNASNVHVNNDIAKVSIVGAGMVDRPGIAADMFKSLADAVFSSSRSVMSDSLRPHGLQHTRLPCPSPTPGACSNSCPSSR